MSEEPGFRRILWLSRWVELLGVVGSVVATVLVEHAVSNSSMEDSIRELSGISRSDYHWLLLICAAMAAWNVAAQSLDRRDLLTRASVTGLAVDLAFVLAILARTNGLQSPFYGLLFLVVMGAALWSGVAGGTLMAFASTVGVVGIEMAEVVRLHDVRMVDLYARLGAPEIFSRLPYLFLVAWLTGAITEAFRRETERRLASQRETERLEMEQRSMATEMEAARKVQESLMPSRMPSAPNVRVAVRYQPAGPVGGDMYAFPRPEPGEIGMVLADVSGHSLPAALLVASAKGALYDAQTLPPGELMAAINRRLLLDCGDDRFVTMVYARLDPATLRLAWVNAGHPSPIVLREGSVRPLAGNGVVLGIFPGVEYREHSTLLAPGDALLLYSDGLMEREQPGGRITGFDDLKAALTGLPATDDAEEMADAVLEAVERMGASKDDVTLMVIQIAP